MSTRRTILLALASAMLSPMPAAAQVKPTPILIGWLNSASRESSGQFLVAFREGLAALGRREGAEFAIEERWADGDYAKLPSLAEELATKKSAVIVAGPLQATVAAAKAAPGIPIIQADGGDLVAAGLAASLARPGRMVTGLTNVGGDVSEKYLELLLETSPKLQRIGVLADPGNLNLPLMMEGIRRSMAKRPVEVRFAQAMRPDEIERAMTRLAKEGAQGLVVLRSAMFKIERARIVKLALARRWPFVGGDSDIADAGMLLGYGHDSSQNYGRAAYYVDRILKGIRPGDLPIEQPTKISLVVNMKTARALGIKIPQSILLRADRVIE